MTAGHPEVGPDRSQPEGLTGILDALAAAVEDARAMPMSSSVLVTDVSGDVGSSSMKTPPTIADTRYAAAAANSQRLR